MVYKYSKQFRKKCRKIVSLGVVKPIKMLETQIQLRIQKYTVWLDDFRDFRRLKVGVTTYM
jgi:hypothetical protein